MSLCVTSGEAHECNKEVVDVETKFVCLGAHSLVRGPFFYGGLRGQKCCSETHAKSTICPKLPYLMFRRLFRIIVA